VVGVAETVPNDTVRPHLPDAALHLKPLSLSRT
jgi:hypothetical protein